MAKRIIRLEDDELLRKVSKSVKTITPAILTLLEDMRETMYGAEGVGLAAVQVGALRRIVLIDVTKEGDGLIEMINPEIIEEEGEQSNKEGCLSIPGYTACVDRPKYIKAKYFDREMNEHIIEAEDYLAVAICHEIDHLNGVMFTDKSYELAGNEDDLVTGTK